MSVNYSAEVYYGIELTQEELQNARQMPNWEDFYDEWCAPADGYDWHDSGVVAGICVKSCDEGEAASLNIDKIPIDEAVQLMDALSAFGISRSFGWILMCRVS